MIADFWWFRMIYP